MPQATDELQNEMKLLFGDSIDDTGPTSFLQKSGYSLTKDFQWRPPEGVNSVDDMTEDAYLCMAFLCDEWDFGGLVNFGEGT